MKAANTEVDYNFLKYNIKIESSGFWLINNDVCCLNKLGLVGVSDLLPYKILLKVPVRYAIPSPCDIFMQSNKYKTNSLSVTDSETHVYKHRRIDTYTRTDSKSYNKQKRTHREH